MPLIAVGKKSVNDGQGGNGIIGSGKGINKGRLAGGSPLGVTAYLAHKNGNGVFGHNIAINDTHAQRSIAPGGLVDKQQQKDPTSTTYTHPFGPTSRSTGTQQKAQPLTGFGVTQLVNPLTHPVPEIQPNERGKFFTRKPVPIIKTQFGANKSGAKSDTAFHPAARAKQPVTVAQSALATEKSVNAGKHPSFKSNGNLWNDPNNSFHKDSKNAISGQASTGRWSTVKKGAVS